MTPVTPTIPESTDRSESIRHLRSANFAIVSVAWLTGMAITGPVEWFRIGQMVTSPEGVTGWFFDWNVDTTPYFLLLIVSPLVGAVVWWHWPSPKQSLINNSLRSSHDEHKGKPFVGAVSVGVLSVLVSWWVAWQPLGGDPVRRFGELPPAYHDEYSYLFQAETFLAGQTWFPSYPEAPELFDQVHVLNGGKFASRYFPGTGMWIAPFLAIGHPHWGHWLAAGFTAAFVFLAGWELGGRSTAWWGGVLTAFSPGLGLFSNLLLSHHPTLAGLFFFLWQYLRMLRTANTTATLLAGCGLSFAMLCRPMSAAGFGFPFGVWFIWWVCRGSRWKLLPAMGLPLLAGMIVMLFYNHSITGQWTETPYQLYTDIYTPRHVYGFNNVERGERNLGPKVLSNYDKWAENLDWPLARKNLYHRLLASSQWTWGLVPLALSFVVVVGYELIYGRAGHRNPKIWLVVTAIVSLHLAHIPYWYDGIMHWHYVFETAPLWLLIAAIATVRISEMTRQLEINTISVSWKAMFLVAWLINFTSLSPFWNMSKIEMGVNNIGFSRLKYAAFQQVIERGVTNRPAVVFVRPDETDRHIDFVTNSPQLNDPILIARWKTDSTHGIDRLNNIFPGRSLYLLDARTLQLQVLHSVE